MGEETNNTGVTYQNVGDSVGKEPTTSAFPFQLTDVRLFQVKVERHTPEQEGEEPPSLSVLLIKGEAPPTASEFSLWLQFETEWPHSDASKCSISLSMEGYFKAIVDPTALKAEVIDRFKEADAILLLWPYLRETLHSLTERMRLEVPPLPVIDARALITVPLDESVEEDLFETESE